MTDVAPPSWTLILPKSWDESKTDFKGEVDGFKIEEVEGSPLVFPLAIQDSGGRDQCTPGRIKVGRRNERVRAKRCDAVDWDSTY